MTHCDASVRSARDKMKHNIGSNEPDVIIASHKDQKKVCKNKAQKNTWKLYEAQVARGRYFVHELSSEVYSRMECVAKIMAMPRTRTDSGMFGLAASQEGGPGFVNARVRTVTNARQVGMRMRSKCTGAHRHARVDASNTIEKREHTGTWVRQVA